ncbi:hypothetical protein ACIGFK_35505 [Streptomyces sp. NPDC085524]|uniref:hypothetical protein n=1 Tax=Streptomyces sp. NPDC085524 TaxID=3365728 RepID=UPI0037CF236D
MWALDDLAAIGPAAAEAVPRQRLCALLDAPPEGQSFAPRALALAYGRLTGDRDPVLALLPAQPGEPFGRHDDAVLLRELGPEGTPYVEQLRELLAVRRKGGCRSTPRERSGGSPDGPTRSSPSSSGPSPPSPNAAAPTGRSPRR